MDYNTSELCDLFADSVDVVDPIFASFGGRYSFGGEITTIKCFEDRGLIDRVLAQPGAGKVLLIDGGGSTRRALFDAAFERVVNTPTRGMGEKTLSQVREAARTHNCSMWQASQLLINENALKGRALNALQSFVLLVTELEQATVDEPLEKHADVAIRQSGLYAMYQAERGEKAQARLENLEELVTACKQFTVPDEAEEMTPLSAFLAHASLEAGETQAGTDQDAVQMMTIHTAKGLEFPMVFMAGVEEGMFPSQMTNDEPGRMEEERRLCYVGMTRAMEKLYITYAESRDEVYPEDANNMSYDYLYQHLPTAKQRLQMAGIRLAMYLNETFDK